MRLDLWTWNGNYFGYREGDDLWTHDGRNVGRFFEDEVFGADGRYLGEIRNSNRLITNLSSKSKSSSSFASKGDRIALVQKNDQLGIVELSGCEDFPKL